MCCRYYLMALLIIPTLFYLPKFFEYVTIPVQKTLKEINPCSEDEGNHTGCTWDENEDAFVTYSYREFNDSELHFSSLRKNYYYRRVSTNFRNVINSWRGSLPNFADLPHGFELHYRYVDSLRGFDLLQRSNLQNHPSADRETQRGVSYHQSGQ